MRVAAILYIKGIKAAESISGTRSINHVKYFFPLLSRGPTVPRWRPINFPAKMVHLPQCDIGNILGPAIWFCCSVCEKADLDCYSRLSGPRKKRLNCPHVILFGLAINVQKYGARKGLPERKNRTTGKKGKKKIRYFEWASEGFESKLLCWDQFLVKNSY